jgi:ribA/ribD-fused uncharacterized protein
MTAITRFRGSYAFLSNFYSSPIVVNGIHFPTVEHAFQAAKVRLDHPRRRDAQILIAQHPTAAGAKQAGRTVGLRADWKTAHLPLMRRLLKLKFAPGSKLADALIATQNLPLIEGNDWKDTYWGVYQGQGRNQLGVLLMELRAELQAAKPVGPLREADIVPAGLEGVLAKTAPKRPLKAGKPAIQPSRDQLIDRNIAAGLELGAIPI